MVVLAHPLPTPSGTLRVDGNIVDMVVSAAAYGSSEIAGAQLGPTEAATLGHRLRLVDGTQSGKELLSKIEIDRLDRAGAWRLTVKRRIAFPSKPTDLALAVDFPADASWSDPVVIRASGGEDGTETELAILDRAHPSHHFFCGAWPTFRAFLGIGIEHILAGPDHLLFLLTIIPASYGWRRRLRVTAAFTVAHSITLTMASLGVIDIDPRMVEPAIAASIVLVALHNLLRASISSRWQVAVVFSCGLLHGLGFASSLGDMGLDGPHRLASLTGFNAGIEIGQGVFVVAILASAAAARRVAPRLTFSQWRLGSYGVAAIAGSAMLIDRLS